MPPDRDSHDAWRGLNSSISEPVVAEADPDWSDYENSDPFADIDAGIAAYRRLNDGAPPKLVISPRLRDALLGHPLVLQRLRFITSGTPVTPALLAQLFDVADVIVV